MRTDKIRVSSKGAGREEALRETGKFAAYQELDKKESLRLELLCEETLGLISAIAGDFEAEYWLESRDRVMEMHLDLTAELDPEKRREMIEASSSGKNTAAAGFMGKVRAVLEWGLYFAEEIGKVPESAYNVPLYMYDEASNKDAAFGIMPTGCLWTLDHYRGAVGESKDQDSRAEEAWDELEKSVVANIADDVRVGVRGNHAELVIIKKM